MLYRILNPYLPKPTLGLLLSLLIPSILEGLPWKHLKEFLLFGVLEDSCNLPPNLHEITGALLRLPLFILACSWSQAPSFPVFPPLWSRFSAFWAYCCPFALSKATFASGLRSDSKPKFKTQNHVLWPLCWWPLWLAMMTNAPQLTLYAAYFYVGFCAKACLWRSVFRPRPVGTLLQILYPHTTQGQDFYSSLIFHLLFVIQCLHTTWE